MNHVHETPVAAPCVMVIFGATGDLTKRKLIPALCNLAAGNLLSKQFAIIGFAGNDFTTESFRKTLAEEIPNTLPTKIDPAIWDWFAERIYYVKGDFQDPGGVQAAFSSRSPMSISSTTPEGIVFFTWRLRPRFFAPIVKQLGQIGLTKEERRPLGTRDCRKAVRP